MFDVGTRVGCPAGNWTGQDVHRGSAYELAKVLQTLQGAIVKLGSGTVLL